MKPPAGVKTFQFKWATEVLEKPVFRLINQSGVVTEQSWNCQQMWHQVENLVVCAGYKKGSITMHTLGRAFASAVDSQSACEVRK